MDGIGDGFESGNGIKHAVPKANTNAYALQSGEGRGASNLKKEASVPTPIGTDALFFSCF